VVLRLLYESGKLYKTAKQANNLLQACLKSQQVVPAERFVFVSPHPLRLIVANQVSATGGEVVATVFAQNLRYFCHVHSYYSADCRLCRSYLVCFCDC
jgi:triosephosphate isomerase